MTAALQAAAQNDTLAGYSMGVEGCYYYGCIGYGETISPTPKKILSIGVGQGFSLGTEYTEKLKWIMYWNFYLYLVSFFFSYLC